MVRVNGLHDFQAWEFPPGARFNDRKEWWRKDGVRPVPHQGIDLVAWRNAVGDIIALDQETLVVTAYEGVVINISPDFLGKSVFIMSEGCLLQIYSHIEPVDRLKKGMEIGGGTVIGKISPQKKELISPHLHLSLARVTGDIGSAAGRIDWQNLGQWPLTLIDPENERGRNQESRSITGARQDSSSSAE